MPRDVTRRRVLESGLAVAATGLAGCEGRPPPGGGDGTPGGDVSPIDTPGGEETPTGDGPTPAERTTEEDGTGGLPLGLETVADGFDAPLGFEAPDGTDYWYVADQPGRIYVHDPAAGTTESFLDIADGVVAGGERGLLGLSFHPGYADNRRFYVRYSAPRREGTPSDFSHTFVLAEFRATADGRRAGRDTERTVLEIPQPQSNHNAGAIEFGPDGYLYVAVGDGGGANDVGRGHADDWYDGNAGGNGQDVTENLLGSILRLDVDAPDDGPYGVPPDNPLVGREGLDEHYAWGLRNPWRMSFTDGELFVGDVGQNRREEVDIVEKGGNYGWNVTEGTRCFGASNCPDETPAGEPLIDPIAEYPHSGAAVSGISVIGGFVYARETIPALRGTYVFGDLRPNGRLFAASRPADGGRWPARAVPIADADRGKLDALYSFGRDRTGALYALGRGEDDGGVHRLVPAG